MECIFNALNLYCDDIKKESSFLGFMFDVEIRYENNQPFVLLGGIRFNLIQALGSFQNPNPQFELAVKDSHELNNFQQKYELFAYKSQSGTMKSSLNDGVFEFEDPCSNLWRIGVLNRKAVHSHKETPLM
ncbi:MAG: hypothetical protein CME64_16915 [Halobacteriovoraceae bacterium]|nr:hypothetical protein [Halobacteriovoraceae bacterium]|tara:strand:+ start:207196 stop:207585 length:390 start_codon:yes stop_codon:yes gene_type:complete